MANVVRITLLAWLVMTSAHAEILTGHVVGISDGDTITVLVARQEVRVRLADIDAPESKQAFGSRSKQALSDLCFQKDARLETQGKDRYGRMIATVHCAGRNANAEQVWQGMAWVFDRYAKPDSPLYVLQEQGCGASRTLRLRGSGGGASGTGRVLRRQKPRAPL
jgi:endonuclease YncB( thermonuclease family)